MASAASQGVFGGRSRPHTIVIARGDKVRHWTVRPWCLALGCATGALLLAGGVSAVVLSMAGDKVVETLLDREIRTTSAYEERIADLRNQLDRVTTRQHVDREAVGRQVDDLLAQQKRLAEHFEKLGPLLDKAEDAGLIALPAMAVPFVSPGTADRVDGPDSFDLRTSLDGETQPASRTDVAQLADTLLPQIRRSVGLVEEQQVAGLTGLSKQASEKAGRMADLLKSVGLETSASARTGVGGPFAAPPQNGSFEESLQELDATLDLIERLRSAAARLPLGDPTPAGSVRTSRFGIRPDPFLRRDAMHTGVDFAVAPGTRVHPSGAGQVVAAGDRGGYGLMVEIDHGNGVLTRYAHLSRIDVREGQNVTQRDVIGAVGSSGRSTGPHLHYEVRTEGKAVDPERYIRAGRKWASL